MEMQDINACTAHKAALPSLTWDAGLLTSLQAPPKFAYCDLITMRAESR